MTTPKALAERIARLENPSLLSEQAGLLTVRAPLASKEEREGWLALRDETLPFVKRITIKLAGTDLDLDGATAPAPGDTFQISVVKQVATGELRVFLAASLPALEKELATATRVRVAEMAADEAFDTGLARFEPWTGNDAAADGFAPLPELTNPRTLVRDLTGAAAVPGDLRPWLLRTAPQKPGTSYAAWLQVAAQKVLASLAEEVTRDANGVVYGFSGPPARTVTLPAAPAAEEETAFGTHLQEAGNWVYTRATDAQTRHLLLASEWARTYNRHIAQPLSEVSDEALASAERAYRAYVARESRETLDALAELREAVVEETQKTRDRAQDLASALWKDLAVAAAPFVLKILADAGKVSPNIAAGLAYAAAAFLVFSFAMQVYLNNRFFKYQGESRTKWQGVLSKMLDTKELNEISLHPVAGSMKTYYLVRGAVGVLYLVLFGVLIWFGTATLDLRGTPPASPRPTADSAARTASAAPSRGPPAAVAQQPAGAGSGAIDTTKAPHARVRSPSR